MNKIEIAFNKWKLLLAIIGSALFVWLGIYLVFIWTEDPSTSYPLVKKIVGGISILFFGAVGLFGIYKLVLNKSALVISDEGILDNSSSTSFGLIKWETITGFKIEEMMSQKFLVIHVTNPEELIEQAKGLRKKVMKNNYSMYRTPITIPSSVINYKLVELKALLEKWLDEKQN